MYILLEKLYSFSGILCWICIDCLSSIVLLYNSTKNRSFNKNNQKQIESNKE